MNSPAHLPLSDRVAPVADIGTILVPVDGGPRSRALLRSASALARRVGGRLVILHVYEPLTYAPAHSTAAQLHAAGTFDNETLSENSKICGASFRTIPLCNQPL